MVSGVEKAYFSLPGFVHNKPLYQVMAEWKKDYPFTFHDGFEIEAIYDCPPNCIWNGGGYIFGRGYTVEEMERMRDYYNGELGIPLRLTFTNPALEKDDLKDRFANVVANIFHNPMNEVLYSSEMMADYIGSTYPQYGLVGSIVGTSDNDYSTNEKNVRSVMARRNNNLWNILDEIPEEQRDKIEFLCNEVCIPDCEFTYPHYKEHGESQLSYSVGFSCYKKEIDRNFRRRVLDHRENHITVEDIRTKYLPKGFRHFKLAPRFYQFYITEEISRYFIHPEYQEDFRIFVYETTNGFANRGSW